MRKIYLFTNHFKAVFLFFSLLSVAAFQSSTLESYISEDYLRDLLAGKISINTNIKNIISVPVVVPPIAPKLPASEPLISTTPIPDAPVTVEPPVIKEPTLSVVEVKRENTEPVQLASQDLKQEKVAVPVKEINSVEIPTPDLQIGQAWVKKMPRGTFLVQHVALPTIQDALLWIQKHPNLKNSRVVATYLPNQKTTQYSIVSGPFPSLFDATTFSESAGIPKDPMIRSARFMKEQFSPEQADADAKKRKENKR